MQMQPSFFFLKRLFFKTNAIAACQFSHQICRSVETHSFWFKVRWRRSHSRPFGIWIFRGTGVENCRGYKKEFLTICLAVLLSNVAMPLAQSNCDRCCNDHSQIAQFAAQVLPAPWQAPCRVSGIFPQGPLLSLHSTLPKLTYLFVFTLHAFLWLC